MQAWRQLLVGERQRHFDQASHTGGRCQVAEVALDRADAAKLLVWRLGAVRLCQRLDLDWITDRRGGAVGFDVLDVARVDTGVFQRHLDHGGLALHAGRREAGFVTAVVVDADAANYRVNVVTRRQRVVERLERDHRRAVAEQRAGRVRVEGTGVPVARQHATLLVHVAGVLRDRQRRAAGQRHVAQTGTQLLHGRCNRHQRRRAGGVDAERRTGQVELVGDAGRDVVFFTRDHRRESPDATDRLGVCEYAVQVVAVVVRAGVNADHRRASFGPVTGVFQRVPRQLQQQALLGIQHRRLGW